MRTPTQKQLYDAVMGFTLRTTTRGHRVLHRVSGGRLGRHFPGGQQIVWITTWGRRSQEWKKNPLFAVRDGVGTDASWVITGSNAGQAKLPGWVHNVRARTDGFLEVEGVSAPARFEEVTGEERDRLYAELTKIWKSYATYERMAARYIPVFRVHVEPSA